MDRHTQNQSARITQSQLILWNLVILRSQLDVNVYHVNTQEGSPSHFSNKSYTLIIIFANNQFVYVIIK